LVVSKIHFSSFKVTIQLGASKKIHDNVCSLFHSTKLIVNTYRTTLHIVPTDGERTWETKGVKHIDVLGMDDERQVIVVLSTTTNRMSQPLQVITGGTIVQSVLLQVFSEKNAYNQVFPS
jgi:hypothetical protein